MTLRYLTAIALTLTIVITVSACSGSDSEPVTPTPTTQTPTTPTGSVPNGTTPTETTPTETQPTQPTQPTNSCAIDNAVLKVPLPYIADKVPTVVRPGQFCDGGYDTVEVLNVIDTRSSASSIKQPASGVSYYTLTFVLRQVNPTSTQRSNLSKETGIDSDHLKQYAVIRSSGSASVVGYDLPGKTKLDFFLPTSTSSDGHLQFSSSDKSDLEAVLAQLKTFNGITAQLGVGLFQGSGSYSYIVQLKAFSDVKVIDIQ